MSIPGDARRIRKRLRGEGTPENLTKVSAEGATPVRTHRWNLSGKRTEQAIRIPMRIRVCIDPPELPEKTGGHFSF